jgi:PAS domain S-box-containing protein
MLELWNNLWSADGFMPHGHCYLWRPQLVWLHVISDALTALAYTSIPFTLLYFIRKRRDLPFHWVFASFGLFIIACGATHVMEIWTLWTPTYWLAGMIKAVTAFASLATAILLIKLVPRALVLPTPQQLAKAHGDLQRADEVLEHRVQERTAELTRKNEELERRVQERTAELTRRNEELVMELEERKGAKAALATSEQRFHRLAEAGLMGIFTTDLRGQIREANATFLQMVGYTTDDFLSGRVGWPDITPPEYRHLDERAIAQLRDTGSAPAWEKEYLHKDGSRVPILIGVTMLDDATEECAVFVLDLTERKRDQEAIRRLHEVHEADAKVHALLETAPDAMVIVNEHGRIVFVNAETEKMFGHARSDLLGNSVDLLVPERSRTIHARHRTAYFASATERGAMGSGRPLVGLRRDGTEFPVEIRLSPIRMNDGMLVTSAIRDVTERKRAEQALRHAKDTAEAANAELEAFSYSVAHDLRTPLRAVSGYSTMLLEDYGTRFDTEAQQRLTRIAAGAQRMGEIIDALLSLARLTRTEPRRELVDLSQLGRTVIGQLRAREPDRVVDFVAANGLIVQGDPQLLQLVLDNLLGNAWKFTGKLPAARIELGREEINGAAAFYVRDNGAGFDMSLVDKLFAPFRRLHSPGEFEGTGVGLATVQRIVRRHGGRIWAEGAEAAGATFHFTLPTGAPAAAHPEAQAQAT